MSKKSYTPEPIQPETLLRAYRAPWKGHLVLACRKCQKKLKGEDAPHGVKNLKKAMKRRSHTGALRLQVLQVPCLKLCPKGAVTVCTQQQLANGECSIVRTADDLDALYILCLSESRQSPYP